MSHKKRCPDCMGQGDKRFMPVPADLPKQELTKFLTEECQTCNGTGWFRKPQKEKQS